MEWLQMALGAASVFAVALDWIKDDPSAKIMALVKSPPSFVDHDLFRESNRRQFEHLMNRDIGAGEEEWDEDTIKAYEHTLSYIGSVQIAIEEGEHMMAICRRIMTFALLIPNKFRELIAEQRPRALVVLAHYFALGAKVDYVWWIGKTVQREIRGIQKALPDEWQSQMRWPLAAIGVESG